jgi:Amt family ammonium transporter
MTPDPYIHNFRFKYTGYVIFSIMMAGFVYPVTAHWGWSTNGWLATT